MTQEVTWSGFDLKISYYWIIQGLDSYTSHIKLKEPCLAIIFYKGRVMYFLTDLWMSEPGKLGRCSWFCHCYFLNQTMFCDPSSWRRKEPPTPPRIRLDDL